MGTYSHGRLVSRAALHAGKGHGDVLARVSYPEAASAGSQFRLHSDEALTSWREKRLRLDRWEPKQKQPALEQRRFEEANEGVIEQAIAVECEGFNGEIRKLIGRATSTGKKMLRTCLLDRLRDYQVQNNRHVMASESRA